MSFKGLLTLLPIGILCPWALQAVAEPVEAKKEGKASPPTRNYANLRVGASTAGGNSRPQICVEVSPWSFLSAEACGTGAGILHNEPGNELSHYRAKLRLTSWKTEIGQIEPRWHLGFAELQVGEDRPGFFFTSTGPTGVETAGIESGFSLRFLYPLDWGVELVGEISADLIYVPQAPRLQVPLGAVQPALGVGVGLGF